MIGVGAISAHAIGDATRRALASEWAGPEPAARQTPLAIEPADDRRAVVRKP